MNRRGRDWPVGAVAGAGAFVVVALGAVLAWSATPDAAGSEATGGVGRVRQETPGRLLRRAVLAFEADDLEKALPLLAEVHRRAPIVADQADLLRMRLLVGAERFEDAVALREEWQYRDSPVAVDFYELLGRAHAALGQEVRAREAWERATRSSRSRERDAALSLRIADSFARSDRLEPAGRAYLRIWTRYPELPAGEAASRALDDLEREQERIWRDAAHHLERAQVLYQRYRNEGALSDFEQALALGLPARQRREAEQGRADSLFRLRRYPEAALAYAGLPQDETRRIQEARAYARAGDVPRGARLLEALGKDSKTGEGTRALLIAALLWDGESVWARAAPLYEQVIARAPGSEAASESRWRLAWEAYRSGRYGEATLYFEALDREEPDAIAALRPRYWALRAREHRGDPDAALEYAALARAYPFSYYGLRSRERAARRVSGAPREPSPLAVGSRGVPAEGLERAAILVEAGLEDAARDELARLDARARGLDDRLALAELHADVGAYDRASRLMIDAYNEPLARGPVEGQIEAWWYAWPAPFDLEMQRARETGVSLEPGLVYAIMREESGYRPDVVSPVGARGLLQLMPDTGQRVARELQIEPFHPDALFDPAVNIRLGASYLEGLVRRFEGRLSAAIASYNAGPHVVARWLAREGAASEDDEFVEEIPYNETRAYVKRVLRSLHAYRVLY